MNTIQTPVKPTLPPVLLSLAPLDLQIHRVKRYDGGGFSLSLNQFAPKDAALLIQLYNSVKKTYGLWLDMADAPNYEVMNRQICTEFGTDRFISSIQKLGVATYALGDPSLLLRKAIHDIRGGALSMLTGYASLVTTLKPKVIKTEAVRDAALNARDHAKLMRNAIDDIDAEARAEDTSGKVHFIKDFVNKWDRSTLRIGSRSIEIEVVCSFAGSVTNRCLETSAIDRILYNYINNAARFVADHKIKLTIFSIDDMLIRWVVENEITAEQQAWLQEQTGSDLRKLFLGGVTRGGQGLGLASCTDFVVASFGLYNPDEALDLGYLGAKIIDRRYYAWFHWPLYHPNLGTGFASARADSLLAKNRRTSSQ